MEFDYPIGSYTVGASIVLLIPALIGGWFLVRGRVRTVTVEHAQARAAAPR